jgi:hypothetical protein
MRHKGSLFPECFALFKLDGYFGIIYKFKFFTGKKAEYGRLKGAFDAIPVGIRATGYHGRLYENIV